MSAAKRADRASASEPGGDGRERQRAGRSPGTLGPRDVAPDDLDLPFWEAAAEGRFLVHRCATCGRAYWPASTCIDHGSAAMAWDAAAGSGEVHTYAVVHHTYDPAFPAPYVVAVVRLDEGPFFHTNIVGCEPTELYVGMAVAVTFEGGDGRPMPFFRPVGRPVTVSET